MLGSRRKDNLCLFLLGLGLRFVLISFASPWLHTTYFLPFITHEQLSLSLDPWSSFLTGGGDPLSFPYGIVMLLSVLPGIFVSLLLFDMLLYWGLLKFTQEDPLKITLGYWLSPIVLYVSYWHGQLDLIPTTFLFGALLSLKYCRPRLCGLLLACGISAKLSMCLAVPFFFIFLWRNRRYREFFSPVVASFSALSACLFSPVLFSEGFRLMVLSSPEIQKIYALKVIISPSSAFYFLIFVYLMLVYTAWKIERMNLGILWAFMGIAFSTILLFTQASMGWYVWLTPFLALMQATSKRSTVNLVALYTFSLTGYALFSDKTSAFVMTVWNSCNFSLQVLITIRMFLIHVRSQDYFYLSRAPLSIGIAGDSGSGKDCLANSLSHLFGPSSLTHLSGDNYHKWDRHSPMWKINTHLNLRSNRLQEFTQAAIQLIQGQGVRCTHYDHATGRFSKKELINHNDIVVISGLHAISSSYLRDQLDLKIFLDMDESLRCFFKLHRDTLQRGQNPQQVLETMKRRLSDKKYIEPQKESADLVFRVAPIHPIDPLKPSPKIDMKLHALIRSPVYEESLVRTLIGVCGLCVDQKIEEDRSSLELEIRGSANPEDLRMAADLIIPDAIQELTALYPKWEQGSLGLMQLIILSQIAGKLYMRTAR